MSSYRNEYDSLGDNNPTYSRAGNYPEGQSYRGPSRRPESYNEPTQYADNYRMSQLAPTRQSLAKLNEFRKKVHEVVDLCKGENTDVKGDLAQVITEERKIYDMLNENPSLIRRTVSQQSFPQPPAYTQQQSILYNQPQRRQQLTTPFRPLKTPQVPQSQYFVSNLSQVAARENQFLPNISQSNILRAESAYQQDQYYPSYGSFGGENVQENLHNSFLKLKNTKQVNLNEDALRLIQEIERKASEEIEKLRRQKLELMQRLNLEIIHVNQEKKKNAELQNLLARYTTQPQRPDGTGQNTQYFQAQISRLQNQLQRANELNHNLRLELGSRGSGIPGIEELLRQGQAIRQQTVRLLKLKQEGDSNQRIQELERMLTAERSQKQFALNQLRTLRQRQGQVSQGRQVESSYGYEKSSARGRPAQQGKSVGNYEDLVSEMKRITGF